MKRAAIVATLGALALLAACTQDFDGMFENEAEQGTVEKDDDDDDTKPPTTSSSNGGGGTSGDPVKDKLACGAPVPKCERSTDDDDFGISESCSGCGCTCDTIACPAEGTGCSVSCTGGSTCQSVCKEHEDCVFRTEGSRSTSTCDASSCELTCTSNADCTLDCTTSAECTAKVDATSRATVKCGSAKFCNVTCGGAPATKCGDGMLACGKCPG